MTTPAAAQSSVDLPPGLIVADGLAVFDPTQPGSTTHVSVTVPDDDGAVTNPQFSPDGRRLLVTSSHGRRHISDWAGRRVSARVAVGGEGGFRENVWWADDQHLFVSRFADTGGRELWRGSIAGGTQELLLTSAAWTGGPLASTDKGSVIFHVRHAPSGDEIVRHDFDQGTSDVIVPSATGDVQELAASPDGRQLAFVRGSALWVVNTDGSDLRRAVPPTDYVAQVAWSGDSSHVAYTRLGGGHVKLLNLEAGVVHESSLYAAGTGIAWQPLEGCTVTGTDQGETLQGTPGDDVICAGGGDDTVLTSAGEDVVLGGDGVDTVDASGSAEAADIDLSVFWAAAQGHSELLSVENVTGTHQADVLQGNFTDNSISGGSGDDRIVADERSDDTLMGGVGTDFLDLSANWRSEGFVVDLQAGTVNGSGTVSGVENVGGGVDDQIYGDDGPNVLQSGGDASLLMGRGGDDILHDAARASYAQAVGPVSVDLEQGFADGPEGDDILVDVRGAVGSAHADTLAGPVESWLEARGGDDHLRLTSATISGSANDDYWRGFVDGGDGKDALVVADLAAGVEVSLGLDSALATRDRTGDAVLTYLERLENYRLTPHADRFEIHERLQVTVNAGDGDDQIIGGTGEEHLNGGPGNDQVIGTLKDRLAGGSGDDWLIVASGDGSAPHARVNGGAGLDTVDLTPMQASVRIDLSNHVIASEGSGSASLARSESYILTGFGDYFVGGRSSVSVLGGEGDDRIAGSDRGDDLAGGPGADTIAGRAGGDSLVGGSGRDGLFGGIGADFIRARDGLRDSVAGGKGLDACRTDDIDVVESCPR